MKEGELLINILQTYCNCEDTSEGYYFDGQLKCGQCFQPIKETCQCVVPIPECSPDKPWTTCHECGKVHTFNVGPGDPYCENCGGVSLYFAESGQARCDDCNKPWPSSRVRRSPASPVTERLQRLARRPQERVKEPSHVTEEEYGEQSPPWLGQFKVEEVEEKVRESLLRGVPLSSLGGSGVSKPLPRSRHRSPPPTSVCSCCGHPVANPLVSLQSDPVKALSLGRLVCVDCSDRHAAGSPVIECVQCGGVLRRAGKDWSCRNCGATVHA